MDKEWLDYQRNKIRCAHKWFLCFCYLGNKKSKTGLLQKKDIEDTERHEVTQTKVVADQTQNGTNKDGGETMSSN